MKRVVTVGLMKLLGLVMLWGSMPFTISAQAAPPLPTRGSTKSWRRPLRCGSRRISGGWLPLALGTPCPIPSRPPEGSARPVVGSKPSWTGSPRRAVDAWRCAMRAPWCPRGVASPEMSMW